MRPSSRYLPTGERQEPLRPNPHRRRRSRTFKSARSVARPVWHPFQSTSARAGIGIIGAGWWTTDAHLPSLSTYPRAEVVAIADPSPNVWNRLAGLRYRHPVRGLSGDAGSRRLDDRRALL